MLDVLLFKTDPERKEITVLYHTMSTQIVPLSVYISIASFSELLCLFSPNIPYTAITDCFGLVFQVSSVFQLCIHKIFQGIELIQVVLCQCLRQYYVIRKQLPLSLDV